MTSYLSPYGNVWTAIASGFKAAAPAIKTGAQTAATTWKSLDAETQAMIIQGGQSAVGRALAARQLRNSGQIPTSYPTGYPAPQPAPIVANSSMVPPWLIPVALVGSFGLIAVLIMRRPKAAA